MTETSKLTQGILEILLGLFICFLGSLYMERAIMVLIAVCCISLIYSVSYQIGIDAINDGGVVATIIVLAVAIIVGMAVAIALKHYINKHTILRGLGALALGALVAMVTVSIDGLPKWGRIAAIIVGGLVGWCLMDRSNINEHSVYAWATGFIGAFLLNHGIGQIAGGFPAIAVDNLEK